MVGYLARVIHYPAAAATRAMPWPRRRFETTGHAIQRLCVPAGVPTGQPRHRSGALRIPAACEPRHCRSLDRATRLCTATRARRLQFWSRLEQTRGVCYFRSHGPRATGARLHARRRSCAQTWPCSVDLETGPFRLDGDQGHPFERKLTDRELRSRGRDPQFQRSTVSAIRSGNSEAGHRRRRFVRLTVQALGGAATVSSFYAGPSAHLLRADATLIVTTLSRCSCTDPACASAIRFVRWLSLATELDRILGLAV